jgi:hypothetical protein
MSQNMTVSCRRSASRASSLTESGGWYEAVLSSIVSDDSPARVVAPHSLQNFAVGVSFVPHEPQTAIRSDPHSSQNFAMSLQSLLQLGHFILHIPDYHFGNNSHSPV